MFCYPSANSWFLVLKDFTWGFVKLTNSANFWYFFSVESPFFAGGWGTGFMCYRLILTNYFLWFLIVKSESKTCMYLILCQVHNLFVMVVFQWQGLAFENSCLCNFRTLIERQVMLYWQMQLFSAFIGFTVWTWRLNLRLITKIIKKIRITIVVNSFWS